jgi:hypothetical protein
MVGTPEIRADITGSSLPGERGHFMQIIRSVRDPE